MTDHVIPLDELEHTEHAHEFVGAEHDDAPFSIILVHSRPGVGPKLHRHPYAEVFVVEAGQATFQIGDDSSSSMADTSWSARPARRTDSRIPARASCA